MHKIVQWWVILVAICSLVLAALLSWLVNLGIETINQLLNGAANTLPAPFSFGVFGYQISIEQLRTPTTLAIFGVLASLFIKRLWCWKILWHINLVNRPNLNGSWKVKITPDKIKPAPPVAEAIGDMVIHQTFNTISITLHTDMTESVSITADIDDKTPDQIVLRNQYLVNPKGHSPIPVHEGVNKIVFKLLSDGRATPVRGQYYTENFRNTQGVLSFNETI